MIKEGKGITVYFSKVKKTDLKKLKDRSEKNKAAFLTQKD